MTRAALLSLEQHPQSEAHDALGGRLRRRDLPEARISQFAVRPLELRLVRRIERIDAELGPDIALEYEPLGEACVEIDVSRPIESVVPNRIAPGVLFRERKHRWIEPLIVRADAPEHCRFSAHVRTLRVARRSQGCGIRREVDRLPRLCREDTGQLPSAEDPARGPALQPAAVAANWQLVHEAPAFTAV
jgi:hypothetical protein